MKKLWRKFVAWVRDLFDKTDAPKLPRNPLIPEGGMAESWSLLMKDSEPKWRVRWPTLFSNVCGSKSFCTLNGHVLAFRSYDTDNGAKRPSYQRNSEPVSGPFLCVLYNDAGAAIAWFKAKAFGQSGRLP